MRRDKTIFSLLTNNAFRIFSKSKILLLQLGGLLLVGTTIATTVFSSTYLLSKSKNEIKNNGNPADLTITIPDKILQDSLNSENNNQDSTTSSNPETFNIYNGNTPADLNLQEYLSTNSYDYTFSKNLSLSDTTTGNSFLLSLANENSSTNNDAINKLVIKEGSGIPSSIDNEKNDSFFYNIQYFWIVRELKVSSNISTLGLLKLFDYQNYMSHQPWFFARTLINSFWKLDTAKTEEIIKLLEPITTPPQNEQDYINNYCPVDLNLSTNTAPVFKTNSYFYKLAEKFSCNRVIYNGYGYEFGCLQTIPLLGLGSDIPFSVEYFDKSSYFTVLSSKFLQSNDNKNILDPRTINDVMKLPLSVNMQSNNVNPSLSYYVYNQDTKKYEIQKDFITWFNNLDNKYKITINSLTYLIAGSGDAPNLLYPVTSPSQLLVNSNTNAFAYVNNLGFNRALAGTSYQPIVYYSVRYPPDSNHFFEQKKDLANLQKWTTDNYGEQTAYLMTDSKQPNRLIYVWSNFLNSIQYLVTTLGLLVAGIIILLSTIFICLLIRSIIKINKSTFAIVLANGGSKKSLAASFFPFALIPALVIGSISFFVSYFLTNPFLSAIGNYWTLALDKPQFYWWVWLLILVLIFGLLFIIIIVTVFVTLKKSAQVILSSNGTFRVNSLIIHTKNITNRFSPLMSFRTTFMMSNISRFVILLFSVISIITLLSLVGGTTNLFKNALNPTLENKNYLVAYDLYSPTINSGYYSAIPYDQLGTSQQGDYNSYDVKTDNYLSPNQATGDFYNGQVYNDALSYPYANNLWFTSLFMTNSNLANDINWNFHFMDNRVFCKLLLDVNVNALGAILNPWEFAKQIIPESISFLANENTQKLVETNYDFYYWLQQQNNTTKPIHIDGLENTEFAQFNDQNITYQSYLPNVYGQPFTLDNSDLTSDYLTAPNQNQWILMKKFDQTKDKYVWALNENFAINGAPSFTVKPQTAKLFVELMTNNSNPLFRFWYMYCYDKNPNKGQPNQVMPDYNYKLAQNVVPVDLSTDETYTYLDTNVMNLNDNSNNLNKPIKIYGIKPYSKFVNLFDKNQNNLLETLNNYVVKSETIDNNGVKSTIYTYPLVINKIVHLKNGWNNGDVLTVSIANTFDRFNLKNIGQDPNYICKFEIVGILDTNYDNQYYTLQKYANQILGYQPTNLSANLSNQWTDRIHPASSYVPFNGVFSRDPNFKMIKNFGGFYTPSGLSTIIGNFGDKVGDAEDIGPIKSLLNNNSSTLDEQTNLNKFVDRSNNNAIINKELTVDQQLSFTPSATNSYLANKYLNKIIDLFDLTSAIVIQVSNVDSPYITTTMSTSIDQVINNAETIVAVAMIPTILIIIALVAFIIILESKRLISLMSILGYSNIKNIFSFMFVYLAVWLLGTLLSVPIIYGIFALIKFVSFSSFNIIVSPLVPYGLFVAGTLAVGVIFALLFIYVYIQMKRINLAQEIGVKY